MPKTIIPTLNTSSFNQSSKASFDWGLKFQSGYSSISSKSSSGEIWFL